MNKIEGGRLVMPRVNFSGPVLCGERVESQVRTLGEIGDIFMYPEMITSQERLKVAYNVSNFFPEPEGTPGGLFFGVTRITPGTVGEEYYMTRGHFHSLSDRTEYYWGIEGEGVLILMDGQRRVWGERMFPGSLHYIPKNCAHRVANVCDGVLSFGACWPSDAGHDYGTIDREGFAMRLMKIDNRPQLIKL